MNFQRMFNKAHEENCKQIELEMKKALESDKSKMGASHKEVDHLLQAPIQSSNVHWGWALVMDCFRERKIQEQTVHN